MSMAYLAQPDQQQKLEWLDGGTLSILLDSAARRRRFTCTPGKTKSSC
ncbi:hypothetical protein ACIA5G_25395 [Amycolatopsis sp. NPDC051758]